MGDTRVGIPREVSERVRSMYPSTLGRLSTEALNARVSYFQKCWYSRCVAWIETTKRHRVRRGPHGNPWRKCHTDSYWCWVRVTGLDVVSMIGDLAHECEQPDT